MDPLWQTVTPLLMLLGGGLIVYIVMRNRPGPPGPQRPDRAETERLFQLGFERAPIGIAYFASDGSWLHVNARLLQLLGYERSEFSRTSLRSLTHTEDRKREAGMMAAVRSGRSRGFTLNKRLRKSDGTYEMFRFSICRVGGAAGTVFQCIIDEAPPEADGQGDLAAALEGVPEISVIGLDSGGMITSWNRGAEELFGYDADEMMGRPWTRLHAVEQGNPGEANRELVKAARSGRYEGRDTRKRNDDGVVSVDVIIVARFRGRDLVGFVEVSRDSSLSFSAREYRTAYERLKRLDEEKIERLGESNDQMRAELDRHAGMESSMRDAHEKLRGANRELTGRIRILSGALRKLIDQRKSLQEKARTGRGRNVDSEELVSLLPETLEWEPMTMLVPRTLAGIAQRGRDVVLVFRSGEAEKRFMVRSGMIVSCSSNSPELLLGQLLVAAGELSESDRQKMIDVQDQTGIAFGRLLLLFELMTEDQIREGMRRKIEREIEELGAWSEGEFASFESEIEPLQIVPVEVAIKQLSAELSAPEAVTAVDEDEDLGPEEPDEPSRAAAPELVASSRARKFHRMDCAFVRRIPKGSRISLNSASEAEAKGLSPCRNCLV